MRRGIAHRRQRPEEQLRASRPEDDQGHARGRPPARAEETRPEGEEKRQQRQEDGRVEDVRGVVAEEPDPSRQEQRVAGRVSAVEASVVGDVALHQHVDPRRQPRGERVEGRPVVEDAAVEQVVREGEEAELVDGEVPGRVLVHRERDEHEQLGRGGEPEDGEHARQRDGREQRRTSGGRFRARLCAAPRGAGCGRRRHAALYPGPERGEKRVGVAARGCYEALVAVTFSPLVTRWFEERLGTPTPAQAAGWPAIARRADTLIAAPTGSGKTLAAFLWSLDRLLRAAGAGGLEERTDVVYVSPLKALGNDVQRNLARPLAEMRAMAEEAGAPLPEIRVLVRSGDTPAAERQAMARRPPHILVTTPESLYILLTAEGSRRWLAGARTVVVDEIHAVAADKRGAHLAVSLERLDALAGRRRARAPSSTSVTAAPSSSRSRCPTRSSGRSPATNSGPTSTTASPVTCARIARPSCSSTRAAWSSGSRTSSRSAWVRGASPPTTAAWRGGRGSRPRRGSRRARCRSWSGPPRSSSASTWGPSTSSATWARRARSRPSSSASAARATRGGRCPRASSSRSRATIWCRPPPRCAQCGRASWTRSAFPRAHSTSSPSSAWRRSPAATSGSRSCGRSCGAPIPSATLRARTSTPSSPCWPTAWPPGAAAGARSSTWTACTAACAPGAARGSRRSRAAAPSPTTPTTRWWRSRRGSRSARSTRTSRSRAWRATSSSSA